MRWIFCIALILLALACCTKRVDDDAPQTFHKHDCRPPNIF